MSFAIIDAICYCCSIIIVKSLYNNRCYEKKLKLQSEMESLPSTVTMPSSVAESLSMHAVLLTKSSVATPTFNPSVLPNKVHQGQKKPLKLTVAHRASMKYNECNPITVTVLPSKTYTVQKERDEKKLREESRMSCLHLSHDTDIGIVIKKI